MTSSLAKDVNARQIENETITTIALCIDASGSMKPYEEAMNSCLEQFKDMLANSKSADEILVSVMMFSSDAIDNGYVFAKDMDVSYEVTNMTALYDAIDQAAEHCIRYRKELHEAGILANSYIVIFTDGIDNDSNIHRDRAREIVRVLQQEGITVAFIAFGDDARGIAEELEVLPQNILESTASEKKLRNIFAMLSRSSISASKHTSKALVNLESPNNNEGFFLE